MIFQFLLGDLDFTKQLRIVETFRAIRDDFPEYDAGEMWETACKIREGAEEIHALLGAAQGVTYLEAQDPTSAYFCSVQ